MRTSSKVINSYDSRGAGTSSKDLRRVIAKVDVIITCMLLSNAVGLCFIPQVSASYRGAVSQSSPCIIEGHLRTDRNWFGYLANITVVGVARLTFELIYPIERCCQNVLFYREDQAAIVGARMNCWQKEYLLRPEDDQILRLTPSFSWSGCHTAASTSLADRLAAHGDNSGNSRERAKTGGKFSHGSSPSGDAASNPDLYVCKGGRSFTVDESLDDPITWYIAVSNCATLYGLDLYYVLEINGQVGECPQQQQQHRSRHPFIDTGAVGSVSTRPTAHPRGHDFAIASSTPPGKALLTAREASVVVQQQKSANGDGVVVGSSVDVTNSRAKMPCVLEGNINTSLNWFGFFANLTLRGGSSGIDGPAESYLGDDHHDASSQTGTTTNSVDEPGWFRFTFTYPYDMQVQEVILYDQDDLAKLHWEQDCSQKLLIVPSRHVPDKILDLSFRSTWNGCETQTVLYNDEPVNLTCTGEKRFDTDRNQPRRQPSSSTSFSGSSAAEPPLPRRIFMALSNCRSSVGLMMHYRLEVFGNVDPLMCSAASHMIADNCRLYKVVLAGLLLMAANLCSWRASFALLPAVVGGAVQVVHFR